MATLGTGNPNFLDLQKVLDPDGSVAPVAEILNEMNDGVLDAMSFMEGNLPTGHRHTVRTGLPTVSRGALYKGVTASRGNTVQVTDTVAQLESMSEIDARLVEMASDPAAFRFIEDRPHIEALHQQFFDDLFYGDPSTNPDTFLGLAPRFKSTSDDNGDNVILAEPAGSIAGTDITSIWLVVWSPATCMGIVPKNTPVGLQQVDHGKVTLENGDGNNGRLEVYRTKFSWFTGLAVPDWRFVVRIGNIDESRLEANPANGGPNLIELMKDAIERIPSLSSGRPAFYANRTVRQFIRKQYASSVSGSTLVMENVGGLSPQGIPVVDGIPVYRVDALATSNSGGEDELS